MINFRNLTPMELNMVRPTLRRGLDCLAQISRCALPPLTTKAHNVARSSSAFAMQSTLNTCQPCAALATKSRAETLLAGFRMEVAVAGMLRLLRAVRWLAKHTRKIHQSLSESCESIGKTDPLRSRCKALRASMLGGSRDSAGASLLSASS
eukprot:SAG31_NODE_282_length_18516_cov_9.338600_6_plen_151_part_00